MIYQCSCNGRWKKTSYNKIGEINPKYCFEHKLPNMINVFNSYKFPKPNLFKF